MNRTLAENPVTTRDIERMMVDDPAFKAFVDSLPEPAVEGLRCPKCNQSQCFVIEVWSRLLMFADGAVLHEDRGEVWDDDSYCRCPICEHTGEVLEFRGDVQDYLTEHHFGENSPG